LTYLKDLFICMNIQVFEILQYLFTINRVNVSRIKIE